MCPVQTRRLTIGGTLPTRMAAAGIAAACKPPGAGCRTPSQQLAHAAACPSSLVILGCDLNPCIIVCLPPAVVHGFVRTLWLQSQRVKDARRLTLKREL